MKHMLLTILLSAFLATGVFSQEPSAVAVSVVDSPADSLTVCRLLESARHEVRTTCFPLYFARQFLGCPYVAHTLEVADPEQLVVNTRELDCTTLVETVTALTLCVYRNLYTYRDYLNALVSLRYRGGLLDGYTSRLHYFTEWIEENVRRGVVEELQSPSESFTATQHIDVSYMGTHPDSYKALKRHPEFVPDIRKMEQRLSGSCYRYIPKFAVRDTESLRCAVADGDIIAITCSKPGLDIAHVGFAVWHSDGLHLLNASQLHKKVVEEPMTLGRYLSQHPSHTGIRVVRILR